MVISSLREEDTSLAEIQLKDFKMHYVEKGTGSQQIIFVHGFISTQVWWQPTLELLSLTHFEEKRNGGKKEIV